MGCASGSLRDLDGGEIVTRAYVNGVPQTGVELREGVKSHAVGRNTHPAEQAFVAELVRALRKGGKQADVKRWASMCSSTALNSRCVEHRALGPFALCATPAPLGMGMCDARDELLLRLGEPIVDMDKCSICRIYVRDAVAIQRRTGFKVFPSFGVQYKTAVGKLNGVCEDLQMRHNTSGVPGMGPAL